MTTCADIKGWIESNLPNSQAQVEGDGHHFEALVLCADFAEKNTIARHRMVYAALGDKMHTDIHALALKTLTPEEYK